MSLALQSLLVTALHLRVDPPGPDEERHILPLCLREERLAVDLAHLVQLFVEVDLAAQNILRRRQFKDVQLYH